MTDDTIELVKQVAKLVKIKDPLFVAKVNTHGQIVIPEWVRDRYGFDKDSKAAVYQI